MADISHITEHMSRPGPAEEEALRLLQYGYHPLPLDPETKHPPIKWERYQDEQPSAQQIHDWFKRFPDAGLCITPTGMVVIDIDEAGNPWPEDPDHRIHLFNAPTVLTPRGGSHHWFKLPPGKSYKNSAGKLAPKVDVRTYGGIAVVPPTTKKNGRAYSWLMDEWVSDGILELPELPYWLEEMLDEIYGEKQTLVESQAMARDIPEGNRDNYLFRAGCYMRRAGFSEPEICAALLAKNAGLSNPIPVAQVRKIANSAAKHEPDQTEQAIVEDWAGQDRGDASVKDDAIYDPGPIPENLLTIPGLVADVMDITMSSAPYPNRPLAFAGALVLLATLAGRKVKTTTGLRTNFYIIALGKSGVGKDHPRKVNKCIMHAAGIHGMLIGGVASGPGLEDAVMRSPALLSQMDEIDEMMMAIRRDKSGVKQNLPKVMMEMFTSADNSYEMRAKAGQEEVGVIHQPNLSVLGSAVPERFYESVSARMLSDGFIGRSLIIEAGKRGKRKKPSDIRIPEQVENQARWWAGWSRGNLSTVNPSPMLVEFSTDADGILEAAADKYDAMRDEAERRGDDVAMSIWARAWEHASKLALLYSVSGYERPYKIGAEAAEYGVAFMDHQAARLIASVHGRVAENDFHAIKLKIRQKCIESSGGTISHSRLLRLMHMPAADLNKAIDTMIVAGELAAEQATNGGKNYRIIL